MSNLTACRLRELLDYDADSGVFTWRVQRSCLKPGVVAGCVANTGYRAIRIDGTTYKASRLVFLFVRGRWPLREVDHRDRNPLNDSWNNLRESTRSQNMANAVVYNSLNARGVKRNRKNFQARITVNYRRIDLGTYSTIAEAAAAYQTAAVRIFGPFAFYNSTDKRVR